MTGNFLLILDTHDGESQQIDEVGPLLAQGAVDGKHRIFRYTLGWQRLSSFSPVIPGDDAIAFTSLGLGDAYLMLEDKGNNTQQALQRITDEQAQACVLGNKRIYRFDAISKRFESISNFQPELPEGQRIAWEAIYQDI